jgi:2-oxoglutarate ferredoxin oxidoreductase subunit beta
MRAVPYEEYLRTARIPHIWCPGCGHGIALKAMVRAIDQLGWKKDEIAMVSGIGCSGRAPGYVDFNTLHTTHGRAIAFATGVKLANPSLKVIVVTGDGDGIAIGGNHLIHAARRNLDINVVLFNNFIYGMTGGQVSPTTPLGCNATTAPFGNYEHPFNIAELVAAAGGNFVARGTVYQPVELEKLLLKAFEKKGFSFVEAMSPCPTAYGRRNKLKGPVAMMVDLKERSVPLARAKNMGEPELEGKIVTGVLLDRNKEEYSEIYRKLTARLGGA